METRPLGKEGPPVPVIGLGAWPLGGGRGRMDEATAIRIVRDCVACGITLIDTAQSYHTSEAVIGKALRGLDRDRVFLATKVSHDFSPAGVRAALEASLRQLGTDHVELYQIHRWDAATPIEATMEALARLREEGKIGWIGVSNFSPAQIDLARRIAPVHSAQPLYSMFDRQIEADLIPYCAREGIGLLPYAPLAQGLLGGTLRPDRVFAPDDERSRWRRFKGETYAAYLRIAGRLAEVAADKGLSLPQLAIAWLLRLEAITCVLVGMGSPAQVEPPLGAVGVTFSAEELARIEAILADTPDVPIYT